jgi:hypothetical protein
MHVTALDVKRALNAFLVVGLRAWGTSRRATRRPLRPPDRRPYPKLFVVGCPRSGTTWVASMLQRHPRAIGTVESHAYDTVLGPFLFRGLRGDAGWRVVLTRYELMKSKPWGVGLHRYVSRPTFYRLVAAARAERLPSDVERAEWLIAWIYDRFFADRGGTGADLLVEKTPRHQFYAERILRRFPEARLVEVVRDGRDVCVSMAARPRGERWPPRDRRDQVATWVEYVERGRRLAADPAFRGRVLQVRYEALQSDPVGGLRCLLTFAGLGCSDADAARIVAETEIARSRPAEAAGPPRRSARTAVGEWKAQFTVEDSALFERLAGVVSRELGY